MTTAAFVLAIIKVLVIFIQCLAAASAINAAQSADNKAAFSEQPTPNEYSRAARIWRFLAVAFLVGAAGLVVSFWLPSFQALLNLTAATCCVLLMMVPASSFAPSRVRNVILGTLAGLNVVACIGALVAV